MPVRGRASCEVGRGWSGVVVGEGRRELLVGFDLVDEQGGLVEPGLDSVGAGDPPQRLLGGVGQGDEEVISLLVIEGGVEV